MRRRVAGITNVSHERCGMMLMLMLGIVRCAREIAAHQHETGGAEGGDQTEDRSNAHNSTLSVSSADATDGNAVLLHLFISYPYDFPMSQRFLYSR